MRTYWSIGYKFAKQKLFQHKFFILKDKPLAENVLHTEVLFLWRKSKRIIREKSKYCVFLRLHTWVGVVSKVCKELSQNWKIQEVLSLNKKDHSMSMRKSEKLALEKYDSVSYRDSALPYMKLDHPIKQIFSRIIEETSEQVSGW